GVNAPAGSAAGRRARLPWAASVANREGLQHAVLEVRRAVAAGTVVGHEARGHVGARGQVERLVDGLARAEEADDAGLGRRRRAAAAEQPGAQVRGGRARVERSEEHTSELQ